jgi:hypothetical protein
MTKIKNTNAYPFDVNISDADYVIGTDADNLGKVTRNYNIGDLRNYINSGLSPETGGTLKVSEITYTGILTSPSEVANSLDPNYEVLQYHVVIFNINGNKYILKEQNIILGLLGTEVIDDDFILIIGFTKLGDGTNVLKSYNSTTGLHEFYSIKKSGDLLNLTESLGNIVLSINEEALIALIEGNLIEYTCDNIGASPSEPNEAFLYKETFTEPGLSEFKFRSIYNSDGTVELNQLEGTIEVNSKCFIEEGDNITITGLGTLSEPYVVNSINPDVILEIENGYSTSVEGDGSTLTPYKVNLENLQKTINTFPYTLTSEDDKYTIFVDNGASNVVINVPNGLVNNFTAAFIQKGTGDVTIQQSGSATLLYPSTTLQNIIKGQYYWAMVEKEIATNNYYLMGSLKTV